MYAGRSVNVSVDIGIMTAASLSCICCGGGNGKSLDSGYLRTIDAHNLNMQAFQLLHRCAPASFAFVDLPYSFSNHVCLKAFFLGVNSSSFDAPVSPVRPAVYTWVIPLFLSKAARSKFAVSDLFPNMFAEPETSLLCYLVLSPRWRRIWRPLFGVYRSSWGALNSVNRPQRRPHSFAGSCWMFYSQTAFKRLVVCYRMRRVKRVVSQWMKILGSLATFGVKGSFSKLLITNVNSRRIGTFGASASV